MKVKVVLVNRNWRVLELNHDLYALALLPGIECEQRVFVEAELVEYTLQAGIGSHATIVATTLGRPQRMPNPSVSEQPVIRSGAPRWDRA